MPNRHSLDFRFRPIHGPDLAVDKYGVRPSQKRVRSRFNVRPEKETANNE